MMIPGTAIKLQVQSFNVNQVAILVLAVGSGRSDCKFKFSQPTQGVGKPFFPAAFVRYPFCRWFRHLWIKCQSSWFMWFVEKVPRVEPNMFASQSVLNVLAVWLAKNNASVNVNILIMHYLSLNLNV